MDDLDALLSDVNLESVTTQDNALASLMDSLSPEKIKFTKPPVKKSFETIQKKKREVIAVPIAEHQCIVCDELIESDGIKFKTNFYHSHHFTCCQCGDMLKNQTVFQNFGQLYCKEHYNRKFGKWCEYCKELIKGDGIEALGHFFHNDHFFCAQCGVNLANSQYFEHKEKVTFANRPFVLMITLTCLPVAAMHAVKY